MSVSAPEFVPGADSFAAFFDIASGETCCACTQTDIGSENIIDYGTQTITQGTIKTHAATQTDAVIERRAPRWADLDEDVDTCIHDGCGDSAALLQHRVVAKHVPDTPETMLHHSACDKGENVLNVPEHIRGDAEDDEGITSDTKNVISNSAAISAKTCNVITYSAAISAKSGYSKPTLGKQVAQSAPSHFKVGDDDGDDDENTSHIEAHIIDAPAASACEKGDDPGGGDTVDKKYHSLDAKINSLDATARDIIGRWSTSDGIFATKEHDPLAVLLVDIVRTMREAGTSGTDAQVQRCHALLSSIKIADPTHWLFETISLQAAMRRS